MTAKKNAPKELSLAKVLDLNEASALHAKLMTLRGSNLVIDASGVERAGALCVQVLIAAARSWEKEKLSFGFSKLSDSLAKTLQLIGVNHEPLLIKETGK